MAWGSSSFVAHLAGLAFAISLASTALIASASAQIGVEYVPPTEPSHLALHDRLKAERWLERMQTVLRYLRLPRPVTLRLESCGEVDAWFEKRTVAVCYEYLQVVVRRIQARQLPGWVTAEEALAGAFVDAILHETAHALFEQQRIPLLGREEEAADQVSAYLILSLGGDQAPGLVRGVAQLYLSWIGCFQTRSLPALKSGASPREARAHPTAAQRLYNLVCIALGADKDAYAALANAVDLPEDRASDCEAEHTQLSRAFKALVAPYVDRSREADARRELSWFAGRR
jgi:hypothetical protein